MFFFFGCILFINLIVLGGIQELNRLLKTRHRFAPLDLSVIQEYKSNYNNKKLVTDINEQTDKENDKIKLKEVRNT